MYWLVADIQVMNTSYTVRREAVALMADALSAVEDRSPMRILRKSSGIEEETPWLG